MRLRDTDDPITVWQDAERYLGGGTRTYSPFSADLEISRRYHPQLGEPTFALPTFEVPPGKGTFLDNGLSGTLGELYRTGGGFLLPVHPDTLAHPGLLGGEDLRALAAGPPLRVVPLANARTVLVRAVGERAVAPHFLKLHFPGRLSRFARRLRRPIIELQLWVSRELTRVGVPFLPEVGAGVLGDDPVQGWGYLLREAHLAGGAAARFTVPLFALYGHDVRAPADPTLLEQLVTRSGLEPGRWLVERVVEPMVALWLRIAAATGCLPEMHGQNTLVTFSADGRRVGVGYRDCGVYVDPALRRAAGLDGALPPRNVISGDVRVPAARVMSLVYDTFMGHHALSYLAALARDRWAVPESLPHTAARATFRRLAGPALRLPDTVYNYDGVLRADGGWHLVDTGTAPRWR